MNAKGAKPARASSGSTRCTRFVHTPAVARLSWVARAAVGSCGCQAPLSSVAGNASQRPARARRHSTIAERDECGDDDQPAVEAGPGTLHQEYWQRHQRQIEESVQDHRRQEAEAQEDEPPDQCRHEQLDQPRVGGKAGVVGMRGGEDQRLEEERGDDQRPPASRSARR